LQFRAGESAKVLDLDGSEMYSTVDLDDDLRPGQEVTIKATKEDGTEIVFKTICRCDTPIEIEYYRNGGILHTVLLNMLKENNEA
ncbi:MAG: hypothetical protein ACOC9Z_04015, partial [Chloroflexota bacterium]